jgi:hypothetical protein
MFDSRGNDMNPMCSPENGRGEEKERKTNQISVSALDRTIHDIANQLSIIYLCCCELRHSLAEKLLAYQLNELGMIEVAAQESAGMIERLKSSLQGNEPVPKNAASVLKRVEANGSLYPIASYPSVRR